MKIKILSLLLFSFVLSYSQFQKASFMLDGNSLSYRIMFPKNYDEKKQYPLVVFLHGSGERGVDNEKQISVGKDFLENMSIKHNTIVIVPQCPIDNYWATVKRHEIAGNIKFDFSYTDKPTKSMGVLIALLEDWLSSGKINKRQVYVGGLSMGAMGTYEILWRKPQTFAAAFAISGGGDSKRVSNYAKNTAMWIFHGESDNVVPVWASINMYLALKEEKADVKYTEYPKIGHDSWNQAFKEKELLTWLFSHKM